MKDKAVFDLKGYITLHGWTNELVGKSFKADSEFTKCRKAEEDNLIRIMYTMFPYGLWNELTH